MSKTDPLHTQSFKRRNDSKKSARFESEYHQIDRKLTEKLALCANPNSGSRSVRFILKLLEMSFHGVPWLIAVIYLMFTVTHPIKSELYTNLLSGLLLDLIVVLIIKFAVRRPRPKHNVMDMPITLHIDAQFSFPSGHTTRAFLCLCFLLSNLSLSMAQRLVLILWSTCTAVSRILLGRHYVSDVLAGSLIGILQYAGLSMFLWIPADLSWQICRLLQDTISV